MANKKTLSLTKESYLEIVQLIRNGFDYGDGKHFRGNERLATILNLEANLGLRISDVLQLRLIDIVLDGDRYRLDIIEKKTKKARTFTVPMEVYLYIQNYAIRAGIRPEARLFPITVRAVQKQLKIVADYMGLDCISTHSFRKYFATDIYVNSDYNIELVRVLLQHSSVVTTQRYIGIQQKELERALQNHVKIV
ncbi:tyrosine-type recombinase/integrase [Velocimicrobium porci]|uniref:Tyrosine-type recombinase/integrase n=1 Tax=Velocimicrobium porci TaxID=2606634 RepID=A0A6L5XYM2_9FIRM|nr:tyrosine-type recombinase/integrase [Velocimicrobium porci]MSS63976.1 tyrosine-type recombinase/integrase [Velocimicrobium porci]